MAAHQIKLHNFGPINDFELDIKDFTLLTGPQASGKSTVAKAVFFCRTIKNEIFNQLTMPTSPDIYRLSAKKGLEKRLRGKFLGMFGSTWAMPMDMEIQYQYAQDVSVKIFLEKDRKDETKNFVEFCFSKQIEDFIIDNSRMELYSGEEMVRLKNDLDSLFSDAFESIYIPAGRSMITLLTDQLAYIFSSMNESTTTVDYCTRAYVEHILKLRPHLTDGAQGLLERKLHYTQDSVDKENFKVLLKIADDVLKGRYYYVSGEERLVIKDDEKYVKINYASSGQQEATWIFNMMLYYMINRQNVSIILEEPEAHLFPDAQINMAKSLGVFSNLNNQVFVTTHSPYILGEINNLLYAGMLSDSSRRGLEGILWKAAIREEKMEAFHMNNGNTRSALEGGLVLNELIDDAAIEINTECDRIMDLAWKEKEDAGKI